MEEGTNAAGGLAWAGPGQARALSLLCAKPVECGGLGPGACDGALGEVGVGYCESRPGREFGGLNVAAYLQPHSHSHAP